MCVPLPPWLAVPFCLDIVTILLYRYPSFIYICLLSSRAGVLKTFLGLSASIMTTIYVGTFAPDGEPQSFLPEVRHINPTA